MRKIVDDTIFLIFRFSINIITPATIYAKAVIPAKAGIQNWPGCRIGVRHDI